MYARDLGLSSGCAVKHQAVKMLGKQGIVKRNVAYLLRSHRTIKHSGLAH
jgi:hypothetical protein